MADEQLDDVLSRLERSLASEEDIRRWESIGAATTRRELLEHSGVTRVLTEHGLAVVVEDRCEHTRALGLVRSWLAGHTPLLALLGETDAGKTVAAAYALARTPGRYHELGGLMRHRRAAFGGPDEMWRAAAAAQLLVLDELGAEDDAGEAAAALHDLVNRRQRGKRTLLIGNLDYPTWTARYDERTRSRLGEIGKLFRVRGEGLRARVGGAS